MTYFTTDNTPGYSQEDLDTLNAEMAAALATLTPHTTDWYAAAKKHAYFLIG